MSITKLSRICPALSAEDAEIDRDRVGVRSAAALVYYRTREREANRVSNRMNWKAESVLGASLAQQAMAEIRRACDYGDEVWRESHWVY